MTRRRLLWGNLYYELDSHLNSVQLDSIQLSLLSVCGPCLLVNLSMEEKNPHGQVYVQISYLVAHYCKNGVKRKSPQAVDSRSLLVTLIEFLWNLKDLFLWEDLIINSSYCVSAIGQTLLGVRSTICKTWSLPLRTVGWRQTRIL